MLQRLLVGMAAPAILLLWTTGAQCETIRIVPSSTEVLTGSTFDLDIIAENINLGAFDLNIDYSPLLVSFSGVVPDVFLGDTALFEAFFDHDDIGLDTVNISESSLLSAADLLTLQGNASANSFRLARMTFQANLPGLAEFGFDDTLLTSPDANDIDATFFGASVTIREPGGPGSGPGPEPIPEPATWSLLGGVLLIVFRLVSVKR